MYPNLKYLYRLPTSVSLDSYSGDFDPTTSRRLASSRFAPIQFTSLLSVLPIRSANFRQPESLEKHIPGLPGLERLFSPLPDLVDKLYEFSDSRRM